MIESQGKRILIDFTEYPNFKSITYLAGSKKAETLYLVHQNSNKEDECFELATSAEELTNIRNFLINIVNKIEKNYGLKQSIKFLEKN